MGPFASGNIFDTAEERKRIILGRTMKGEIGFPNPIMVARIRLVFRIVEKFEFGDLMAMMRALLKFYHARQRHS